MLLFAHFEHLLYKCLVTVTYLGLSLGEARSVLGLPYLFFVFVPSAPSEVQVRDIFPREKNSNF